MKRLQWMKIFITIIICFGRQQNLQAQDDTSSSQKSFYVKPYGGFIGIQDMDINSVEGSTSTPIAVKAGFGYTAGISFGYAFTDNFSVELGWEYKSNNVEATIENSTFDGNYASNFIYLNGRYSFDTSSKIQPYIGGGITYIEEIDFDFEIGNSEESYAQSGDIGFNILAGSDYNFSERWAINLELRNTFFSSLELEAEENSTIKLKDLKYNPFVVNIGFKYRF